MNTQQSLSIAETNEIRQKLGLKPISVVQDKDADRNESLSIEETNNLVISTGQKHIPSQKNVTPFSPNIRSTVKVNTLREKITEFQRANTPLRNTQLIKDDDTNDNNLWLEKLDAITVPGEAKPLNTLSVNESMGKEDEDIDLHNVQVSCSIEELGASEEAILTLKESSIFDDADSSDVLENEKVAQETTDREKLRLRQMNKDRRQKRLNLHVSSLDIQEEEKTSPKNTLLSIGAEKGIIKVPKPESAKQSVGKIKVNFDDIDNVSDEDGGDFKPLKIKKRKVKDPKSAKTRKSKIFHKMEVVKLVDEDENLSWMNEEQPVTIINAKSNRKKELKGAELVAGEIEKARNEKKLRAEHILKMRENANNFVIDEKTVFLDTLDISLPGGIVTADEATLDYNRETNIKYTTNQHPREEVWSNNPSKAANGGSKNEEHSSNVPCFFSGIASTLGFLRKKNLFATEDVNSKAKKETKVEAVKQTIDKELAQKQNGSNACLQEKHSREQFQCTEPLNNGSKIRRNRLSHYDPDIQLVYRDEKGNQLTTKEAYKKLSQKFHGTKSNKKKKAKMQSRIEARKSAPQDRNEFEFGNS
ncbi:hypothetical protein SKDZ_15G4440 [Saccharomyces kudriavzevii ZP591]|nr:hypothetical protein SKDZ_15G4440 [Saccharomyces kudriavzevii ZP591]